MDKKKEYNDEPVFYCAQCMSLKIKYADNISYCEPCGSTHIREDHIEVWKTKYKNKYGKEYIKNKK